MRVSRHIPGGGARSGHRGELLRARGSRSFVRAGNKWVAAAVIRSRSPGSFCELAFIGRCEGRQGCEPTCVEAMRPWPRTAGPSCTRGFPRIWCENRQGNAGEGLSVGRVVAQGAWGIVDVLDKPAQKVISMRG